MSIHFRKSVTTVLLLLTLLPGITVSGLNSAPALADDLPDLIVQQISLSPSEPAVDDTVTITVTVKNQGAALAGQTYLTCYADSAIIGTATINSLQPGTMTTASFSWKAEPGSHTIKASADSSSLITESNETNNNNTYTFTSRAADLIIQSVTWSPANASRGDTIVFTVVIKNQGNAPSRTTDLNLYIDGSGRGTQDVYAINPGTTATRTYTWVALYGQHAIKAVIDEKDAIRESNESNNEYKATFSTLAPDLVIERINWWPQVISKNDIVSINATVKNLGNGRSELCYISFSVDGEMKASLPVTILEAGASVNITYNYQVISDKHQIKCVVDELQAVQESDENNNEKTASFSTQLPDLLVTSIVWSPINAAVGDTVSFNATIKNYGSGKSENAQAAIYIDGSNVLSPTIPALNSGSEVVIPFTWTAVGGTHAISVMADFNNTLAETDKDNNKLTINIPVVPPDLTIFNIITTPSSYAIDDTVTLTVVVKNTGGGRAEAFFIATYIDDTLLGTDSFDRVDSGATANKTFTWKAVNGRHTLKAVVDYNKYIIENDENNNESSIIVAPNMPDLAVDTITWLPADIQPGKEITFDITIKNLGTLNAGSTRVAYYVDKAAAGYTDIDQLYAGNSVTVHFIWNATTGSHNIDVVADALNKVLEIDETNNTKVISVPLPDLIVQGLTWSPTNATVGDNVTFTAAIKNQGQSRTQISQMACFVDGFPFITNEVPEVNAGDTITSVFSWKALAGTHRIKITADVNNRITESDESNNSKEINFTTFTPDLVVQDISWLMENPLTDDKVDITFTIKNQGTGAAAACKLFYIVDANSGVGENIVSLLAGATATTKVSTYLKAGSHTVNATIDSTKKVDELDESNNTKILTFNSIAPDLIVKSISISPVTAIAGDNVTITVKVENRGREKAVSPKLSYAVDGVTAGTVGVKDIDLGGVLSQDFYWKAIAGNHEIIVSADPGNLIFESNETNNSKSRTLTISGTEASATTKTAIKVNATKVADNKGFVESYWWMVLLAAALLGGGAFVAMLKSIKK